MNIAFIIFWFLIICALIFLIVQATRNLNEIDASKNTYVLDTNFLSCFPGNNVENLPSVENRCCVINGNKDNRRPFYIKEYDLNVLVDTTIIPFEDACIGFCTTINPDGTCFCKTINPDGTCADTTDEIEYYRCLEVTVPVKQAVNGIQIDTKTQGCLTAALPVARLGDTPYYVSGPKSYIQLDANIDICDSFVDC